MAQTTIRETDLYKPIRDYLVNQGYLVHSEVRGCDITAVRGDELVVIELKRNLSVSLLVQAVERQRLSDSVYVAVPRPSGKVKRSHWQGVQRLLRRLELGLITVAFSTRRPHVEVLFHPLPYERKRNSRARRALLREIAGRSHEYNQGGSTRQRIRTAYWENVFLVACALARTGPSSPSSLKTMGTGEKTQSILHFNHYGWFERVERGIYDLTAEGRRAVQAEPELAAEFAERLVDPE
ncbi:MAG: DUF2161 family putative PD-(D/E)XK-type phosphodiesterase [Bacillota bacterium]